MASPPLFDFAAIDRSQVAVSAEQVGHINPQAGAMRQLDRVIWKTPSSTTGLGIKHVRHDEFWVDGHIPGRPLLPGVLMIEAAAQLSSVLHHLAYGPFGDRFIGFARCNNVVFRGQVVPGDDLLLLADEITHGRRKFVSATQAWVEDRLVFEGEIHGILL